MRKYDKRLRYIEIPHNLITLPSSTSLFMSKATRIYFIGIFSHHNLLTLPISEISKFAIPEGPPRTDLGFIVLLEDVQKVCTSQDPTWRLSCLIIVLAAAGTTIASNSLAS